MPTTKDDREVWVPGLDCARDLGSLANHGARDERHSKAKCVLDLFEDSLFEVGCDGRVNQANFVSGAKQRRGNRQDAERRGSLCARE